MRFFLRLIIILICFGTVQSQKDVKQRIEKIKDLEWLCGTWNRTNVKPGRSGFEIWKKESDSILTGTGIALKGTDTLFVEKLKIIVKDDNIYYVADVPENKGVVLFKLITITKNSFVCENPEHDFPKKIEYVFDGTVLKATISGNGKFIYYLFERK